MTVKSITISGNNDLDLLAREKAISKLSVLSTKELQNLSSLADSPKARKYLSDPVKFQTLKTFL